MRPLTILLSTSILAIDLVASIPHGAIDRKGTWTYVAPVANYPRQEHATVALSATTLYVLGGIVNFTFTQPIDPTTALMQSYFIPNNAWSSAASMPMPLNHPNAAVVHGKIYVLGGLAPDPEWYWRAVPNCWVYDPKEDTGWGSRTTVYLAGGMLELDVVHNVLATIDMVSAYDTVARTWTLLPAAASLLPAPRDHAGAAVVGDTFYVLGGRAYSQANVSDTVFALDLYDMASGWRVRDAKMPTARGGLSVGIVGDKVYTFGGEGNPAADSNGVFNNTEAYDTVRDSWEKLTPMEAPRHGTYAVGVGGRVYIPGGGTAESGAPVATFDFFEPFEFGEQ